MVFEVEEDMAVDRDVRELVNTNVKVLYIHLFHIHNQNDKGFFVS